MVWCCVVGCKSNSGIKNGTTFHSFPSEDKMREEWISALGRNEWLPTKNSKVCSNHFDEGYVIKKGKNTYIHHDAVPFKRKMPKRRRLFTPIKHRGKTNVAKTDNDSKDEQTKDVPPAREVSTARGRLQGALMDVLDPPEEPESDTSSEGVPAKHDGDFSSDSEDERPSKRWNMRQKQSYVLKLFDRSVDLSQFDEDTPLYPICRAWIANQPKADYSEFGKKHDVPELKVNESIELPGPEGPPISRIPELLPEQIAADKDNINLNYHEAPPPSREKLLEGHMARWVAVRQAWVEQANRAEARYDATQQCLNKISVSAV